MSQPDTITWEASGMVRKHKREIDFRMVRESSPTSMVKLTGSEKSFKWLVDSLYFEARAIRIDIEELTLSLIGGFNSLTMNHWRISPEDVGIKSGKMDFTVIAGKTFIKADTNSTPSINSLVCNLGFGLDYGFGKQYFVSVKTGKFPSTNLFESLPTGMFNSLEGIKTKGELSYSLDFKINISQPDSLIFVSELKKYAFSVKKFGNEYLPMLTDDFIYTAYDGEKALRSFMVGPFNPWYTPLDEISNYLEVHGIIRKSSSFNTGRIDHLYRNAEILKHRLFLHYGDLIDPSGLNRLLEKIAPVEIYNLAAQSHVKVSFDVPDSTAQVDALGTLRFLAAIRETGLRQTKFYQASTSELFGKVQEVPQTEKTPFYPRSPYGIAKLFAYWTIVNHREAYNVFASNGILFNHESPRRGHTFVTKKITREVARIITGRSKSFAAAPQK